MMPAGENVVEWSLATGDHGFWQNPEMIVAVLFLDVLSGIDQRNTCCSSEASGSESFSSLASLDYWQYYSKQVIVNPTLMLLVSLRGFCQIQCYTSVDSAAESRTPRPFGRVVVSIPYCDTTLYVLGSGYPWWRSINVPTGTWPVTASI